MSSILDLAKTEGMLAGISAGANVYASRQIASQPNSAGKRIVTIICDTGERYLSTPLFEPQEELTTTPRP